MPEVPPVPPPADQRPPPPPAKPPDVSPLTIAAIGASAIFQAETGQSPGEFAAGLWDKAKAVMGVDAVKAIYFPGGMLDQAAQKAVDLAQGIHKPDDTYVSKAEHAKQFDAIVTVVAALFPGLGEMKAGMGEGPAGHTLATPEGVTVHAPAADVTVQAGAGAVQAGAAADMMARASAAGGGDKPAKREPGEWHNDLAGGHNMNPDQARYQEQVTGQPADRTYYVKDVSFDGYTPGKDGAPGTLLEAKHLGDDGRFAKAYQSMTQQEFKDFAHLLDRAENITSQAREQVRAAAGTGARIEWQVCGEKAADAIRVLFGNDPALKDITVTWVPARPPG